MKKINTLFIRVFEGHKIKETINEVTEGCKWVVEGEGSATKKLDGTCCLINDGELFARFDFKPGRRLPEGAIPCQEEPDEITGHWPHWIPIEASPFYKFALQAFKEQEVWEDGTYELIGERINGNPEKVIGHKLIKHGSVILEGVPRDYEGIKQYLEENEIEGIVFHRGNGDMCKIKRTDFGFSWNGKTSKR